MRILQVTPTYPPAWSYGGITRAVYEVTKELCRRGHEVEVWTSDALDLYSRVKRVDESTMKLGAKVCYFRNLSFTITRALNIHITPSMVRSAKRELKNFDVVHLHGGRVFQNLAIYPYARKYGVPYVFQAHGSLLRTTSKQRLKWIYDVLFGYRMLKDASKVFALSQLEAQQYKDVGVSKKKIEIIPNGIDLSEYANLPRKGAFRRKFSIDDDEKIVLYLGRVHESKGLDLLADAFSMVWRDFSNVRLVVVGPDDGYAATFSKLMSDFKIEKKVLLTGFVEKEDKLAALVDSNVFVTPRFRGFPIAFLEACLVGCPIVTTSNALEWIHDKVGYVVDASPVALAKAICKILQDDWMLKRFQNNCRYIIKQFDISTITDRLEDLYDSVVNQ